MAASTQPDILLAQSSCYQCVPDGMQLEVIISLLNAITGLNLTPAQLIDAARCYDCVPVGMYPEAQTMMLQSILTGIG
jgi:hypothetical protein